MSNQVTAVKINGNQYFMKFSFKSAGILERMTGKTVEQVFEGSIGVNTLTQLTYVCLATMNKELTFDVIEDEISNHIDDGGDIKELMNTVKEVVRESDFLKSMGSNSKTY